MSAELFHISETNPNDDIGGGGCVCSPDKLPECAGPFAIFYGCETDSNVSPHVVVSLACAKGIVRKGQDDTPVLDEPDPETTRDDDIPAL